MGPFNSQVEANHPNTVIDERFGEKVAVVTRRNKPYIVKVIIIKT
jgi:hypothetical protein